eukprot:gb/GFBE01015773.1/.p1 GENE.gb/GFBE01015773.1/~~gb/GFBE01015773.1/.p1  ORF type:complete len:230 (+),score=64.63 gb/GFBE01015773.1/:1-690(+)
MAPAPRRGFRAALPLSLLACAALFCWEQIRSLQFEATGFIGPFGGQPDKQEGQQGQQGEGEQPQPRLGPNGEVLEDGVDYEEFDWKDDAYQKQLDRIALRKKKAQPNYKETAAEKVKRLQKLAMWNAAQRKGMSETVGAITSQGQVVDIKVTLQKPLGIDFQERDDDSGKIWVGEVREGFSAAADGSVARGDWLSAVNGFEVEKLPFEDALQYIKDAQGDIELTFKRVM